MSRKYQTLKELAAAFASGELSRDEYRLIVDNDDAHLSYVGKPPASMTEEEADDYSDRKCDECRNWFRGNGYSDVVDACEAAGIPAEWC